MNVRVANVSDSQVDKVSRCLRTSPYIIHNPAKRSKIRPKTGYSIYNANHCFTKDVKTAKEKTVLVTVDASKHTTLFHRQFVSPCKLMPGKMVHCTSF
jgi:hypothetical protein